MNLNLNYETSFIKIKDQLNSLSIMGYARSRNFLNGDFSKLSAYISRGVISISDVYKEVLNNNASFQDKESFIRQLAWREYWQRSAIKLGNKLFSDIRKNQDQVTNYEFAENILNASTSIKAIDTAIKNLYESGYVHNHNRLYIAALSCHIAKSHWLQPAKWLYYNLFDGDIASNHLSWQWVAGTNSHRPYIANQQNINKYCFTKQKDTYLDYDYDQIFLQPIPKCLQKTIQPILQTHLTNSALPKLNPKLPTLIYNSYNLDPEWKKTIDANRLLLLEPSHFKKYPISEKVLKFVTDLSKNINNIQTYVGELSDLVSLTNAPFYAKKHVLFNYNEIEEEEPVWLFDIHKEFSSFSSFWKKCIKPG